jgi:hypothetical protein
VLEVRLEVLEVIVAMGEIVPHLVLPQLVGAVLVLQEQHRDQVVVVQVVHLMVVLYNLVL